LIDIGQNTRILCLRDLIAIGYDADLQSLPFLLHRSKLLFEQTFVLRLEEDFFYESIVLAELEVNKFLQGQRAAEVLTTVNNHLDALPVLSLEERAAKGLDDRDNASDLHDSRAQPIDNGIMREANITALDDLPEAFSPLGEFPEHDL